MVGLLRSIVVVAPLILGIADGKQASSITSLSLGAMTWFLSATSYGLYIFSPAEGWPVTGGKS